MKRTTTAALALVLLATTAQAALAQDGERRSRADWARQSAASRGDSDAAQAQQQPQAAPDAQPQREARDPAQADRRGRGGDGQREDRRAGDGQRSDWNGQGRGQDRGQVQAVPQPGGEAQREGRRDWNGDRRGGGDRNGVVRDRGQGWDRGDGNRGNWRDDGRRDRDWDRSNDGRGWDRGARGDDRRDWGRQARPRYDRRYYPPVYRSGQRYRGPIYRPPIGFYSRSWVFGDILPRGWYGSDYRLDDWWSYGLPVPPIGYDWVRIGDDAVLIDEFTGRIVQVVPNLFW